MTPSKRAEANNILHFILQHKPQINWDPRTMEVILNGRIIPDSDIGSILQWLTNIRVVNVLERAPPGTREVYRTLVNELGMTENWISTRLQLRTSSRRPNKLGSWIGIADWIVYRKCNWKPSFSYIYHLTSKPIILRKTAPVIIIRLYPVRLKLTLQNGEWPCMRSLTHTPGIMCRSLETDCSWLSSMTMEEPIWRLYILTLLTFQMVMT